MRHTVVKPRYTHMKKQFDISWQFPAHPPPQRLRNYNEQAKRISFQIARANKTTTLIVRIWRKLPCYNGGALYWLVLFYQLSQERAAMSGDKLTNPTVHQTNISQCIILVHCGYRTGALRVLVNRSLLVISGSRTKFTHWDPVTHICVSIIEHQRFRLLVAYSAPSHDLGQLVAYC